MPEAAILVTLIQCHNEVFLSFNAQNSISILYLKEFDIKIFKEKVNKFYRTFIIYLK